MRILSPDEKKRIYDILAEGYLDLLRQGMIGAYERKLLSRKILQHIDPVKTFEEVITFIDGLVKIYPAFTNALVRVKRQINEFHEEQVMSHLQSFLHTAAK